MNTKPIALALNEVEKSLQHLDDPKTQRRLQKQLMQMIDTLKQARVAFNDERSKTRALPPTYVGWPLPPNTTHLPQQRSLF